LYGNTSLKTGSSTIVEAIQIFFNKSKLYVFLTVTSAQVNIFFILEKLNLFLIFNQTAKNNTGFL